MKSSKANEVFFTIGIPAFKGRFLNECIDSILSQTYKYFELLIVNDCSPDNIRELVANYRDSRIRYYENESNSGAENVVDNWNKCLGFAEGEYFILMGDDDVMEYNYLEEFLNVIKRYPNLDVYHCRSKYINENSIPYKLTILCSEYESTYTYLLNCMIFHRDQFISDFVYRTIELKKKGGFYKLPLAWGSDFITAFMMSGDKGIAYTYKSILKYRTSEYNISSTGSLDLKRLASIQYEHWIKTFLENVPNDEEDKIVYPVLLKEEKECARKRRMIYITHKIKFQGVTGLLQVFLHRKLYAITLKDFINAITDQGIKSLERAKF